MKTRKKTINVIRPTLRHKKRYIKLYLSKNDLDKKDLYKVFFNNFKDFYGKFVCLEANLTIIDFDSKNNFLVFRVNKDFLDEFLGSLFFLNSRFDLVIIKKVSSTIKSLEK